MKAPLKPPTWELAKDPPFLTASLSIAKGSRRSWCAYGKKAKTLEDLSDAVANSRSWSERQVYYSKRNSYFLCHFAANDLAHPCDPARCSFNYLGYLSKIEVRI